MKAIDSLNEAKEGEYIVSMNNFSESYVMSATDDYEAKMELAEDFVKACLMAGRKTDLIVRRYESPLRLPIIAMVELK